MSEEKRLHGFAPIADENLRVLILGSMPSEASLAKGQYYGFSRNHFWPLIFSLWDAELTEDYEVRKRFLLRHRIALWDSVRSCQRQGSLDSAIKNAVPNDFDRFFATYGTPAFIFFNGKTAEKVYRRFCPVSDGIEYRTLPSTSPANTMPIEKKREAWAAVRAAAESDGNGQMRLDREKAIE